MVTVTAGPTMKAVVSHRPVKPGALRVEDAPRPILTDDGVLVRVHASSANPVDLFPLSPAGYLMGGRKASVAGTDFAGVVEAVGANVTEFRAGDGVFGASRGAFAEYMVVPETGGIARKPAGVSFLDAGTLGVAASTALQALRDHGGVGHGARVLLNGASGGVGTFAVQIAKALGAEVTAVCSARNADTARALGADTVIDYTTQDFVREAGRHDVMVDIAGSRPWSQCKRVLNEGGTYVLTGIAAVQHGKGGTLRALGRIGWLQLVSKVNGPKLEFFIAAIRRQDLEFIAGLVTEGRVRPVIEKVYDLAHAGDALAHIDAGHVRGKLAIEVAG